MPSSSAGVTTIALAAIMNNSTGLQSCSAAAWTQSTSWTVFEGQFGWLLLIIFTSILIAGPGRFVIGQRLA